jgi:DNA-binding transcriptional LysR family regulator
MHLKALSIFCDVVRHRSFSKAANENGVSQSNASQVVHHLEQRLGTQLIDRSRRPFVLTEEGQRYHEGCAAILSRYEELEQEVRSLHHHSATRVTLASIYSVGLAHMSQYLRTFSEAYPQGEVRLEYLHPDRVYEVVESQQADVGIVSYPEASRQLEVLPWRSEPMVVVVPPDHPLAVRARVPLEALRGARFVALEKGLRIREEIDRALVVRHVEIQVALEFDNIETIKRAIEIGAGVSVLPQPTVTREVEAGSLAAIPLAGQQLLRPLGFIHRRDRQLSVTANRFIALLQRDGEATSSNLTETRLGTPSLPV